MRRFAPDRVSRVQPGLTRYHRGQVYWLLLIVPLPFIRVHTGPPSFTPLHYSSIISFSVPPALVALRRILTL